MAHRNVPTTPPHVDEAMREKILEPYQYIVGVPGREIRSMLIDAFNDWLQIPADKLALIKEIVKKLHNASLLIDDIEDNSVLRRGVPVAHTVYGVAGVINCANYVYFEALKMVHECDNSRAFAAFTDEMLNLHTGQGLDIYWRDHHLCPTEEQYQDMVINKTGGLFRLGVRLMQAFSESTVDYVPVVNKLGLYFQILDDYLNLKSQNYHKNKSFAEDLTEGKFSFPVIHSIRSSKDDRLSNILRQRTTSTALKEYAIRVMEETRSFEYTLSVLAELVADLRDTIAKLGGNARLEAIVAYLDAQLQSALAGGTPSPSPRPSPELKPAAAPTAVAPAGAKDEGAPAAAAVVAVTPLALDGGAAAAAGGGATDRS